MACPWLWSVDERWDVASARSAVGTVLGETPAHFRERPRACGRLPGLRARRRAGLDAFGDALKDSGDAKEVVGEVEVPVGHDGVGVGPAGALAVATHVVTLARDAERRMVEAADAAKRARRDVPRHAVVAEVGQRMAERRELPVEHGDDSRLLRIEDEVVEAVVAV